MSEQLSDIKSVVIRIVTDKPVRKTAYQVKGVFMRQYSDEPIIPMLDGTYRDKFLYPRVQVKVLNEQIYLIGIHEGVDAVLSISKHLRKLDFGNITFEIQDCEKEEYQNQCIVSTKAIRYRFITPWVALNRMTGKKYRFLSNKEKPSFLNQLLGQNLLFLANEFGTNIERDIATKVKVSNLFPKAIDENKWGSFKGEFKTNFVIPNYIGIGNGITRGFGTIYGMFDQTNFLFDENQLKEGERDTISEEDMEIISLDYSPKPKRKNRKHVNNKRKRKWANKHKKTTRSHSSPKKYQKNKTFQKSPSNNFQNKLNLDKVNPGNTKENDYDLSDDQRFNTEKHHKKQHKF